MVIKETLRERIIRYRHLTKHFLLYRILNRSWISNTKALHNKHKNQSCFIFATGPSVNRLDIEKIRARLNAGDKLIAINSYISSELATVMPPDYHIISDASYMALPDNLKKYKDETDRDLETIRKLGGFHLLVPHNWQLKENFHALCANKKVSFFNHSENIVGNPNGADITKPRYYLALTAYIGISVALYMGFKNIFLCGFDEDRVVGMEITENNHLIWRDNHFYPETQERCYRDMTVETGTTWESFCISAALSVQGQKKIQMDADFLNAKILNCNPASYVTGFKKTSAFLKS